MDRRASHVMGWLWIAVGAVGGIVGGFVAWDAHLHNAIVANVVENPWPGYLMVAIGLALVIAGVVTLARAGRRLTPSA